ncbi:hypothetical protein CH262_08385 [Rhodococcus sp. 05-2255-1e]|uniref:hypothetical protein n=1 Tax=Rhodococcus sp. 05-2255-1e TaxID=2022495 RepID=UPI000B9A951F|nr:hypothetical protein [Rhodococcus sp. 05-2255-1e]OZE26181.1 hypothetical protein CH262_08385 [Rhodococcus sp. 05-2255-1e]
MAYFETTSDVDLGNATVNTDPESNGFVIAWAGLGLSVALNRTEAEHLFEALDDALGEGE